MQPLKDLFGEEFNKIEFVNADLNDADSLMKAVEGCTYVVHTASPVPTIGTKPSYEDLVNPAVHGTNFVMRAARAHGIKRIVLTSSVAAVCGYPFDNWPTSFNESNWS